ncbi:Shikimate 5-dehydrogenase I alpha [hydrothermal vent metagenome]|uniref:shikimate dehydrogenase (NADP(+)) n=1 Tax=hydrothermal vent metagenome TaxID=652676 RepID=A0A3B1CM55_9ZZZZ
MVKSISLGITGHPIGHSLSPLMHETAALSLGIDLSYKAFDVAPDKLKQFIDRLRAEGIDGLNVTVPHKVAVMEFMDEISGEASAIGAVNTIVNNDGKLTGHNTDGYGLVTSIEVNAGVKIAGKKIFVYGAGGAARAVCHAVYDHDCSRLVIANRTWSKAVEIADGLSSSNADVTAIGFNSNKLVDSIKTADIIINTTSMGMEGAAPKPPPGIEGVCKGQLVVDIVYRPLDTPLLKKARALGAETLDGLWMLIYQGARSFGLWTGEKFPVELIREKLLSELSGNLRK